VVTVVFVRHAEKQLEPKVDDPPLTPQGEARAAALVDAVSDVRAVLSTDTTRTRRTATPVAEAAGLEIQTMQPLDAARISAVAAGLRGGTILVVGHSNSIPKLVEALYGSPMDDIPEDRYGDLFVVYLSDPPRLERRTFGPS
jgi:broad specificity phosphatase PhoE